MDAQARLSEIRTRGPDSLCAVPRSEVPPAGNAVEVWFEVRADRPPRGLPQRITTLTEPDFQVGNIDESARIEVPGGSYRAHWRCRCLARRALDEFAALRLLKRLTGAGFRILRFDNAPLDGARREMPRIGTEILASGRHTTRE